MTLRRQLIVIFGLQLLTMAVMAYVVQRETARQMSEQSLRDEIRPQMYAMQETARRLLATDQRAAESLLQSTSNILSVLERESLHENTTGWQITHKVLLSVGLVFAVIVALLWIWAIRTLAPIRKFHLDIVAASQSDDTSLQALNALIDDNLVDQTSPEIETFAVALKDVVTTVQMQQQQVKLLSEHAAWRSVARELTHEIRNLLTPMKLSQDTLVEQYPSDRHVAQLETGMAALNNLTVRLKELSQLPIGNPVAVNARAVVLDCAAGMPIVIECEEKTGSRLIWADDTQFRSVVNNIIGNAVQAGATSIVVSGRPALDAYFELIFADNGSGMTVDQLSMVRAGRYTSKADGTGTGLMVVRNFVDAAKGSFAIESNVEGGVTVTLRLVAVETGKERM